MNSQIVLREVTASAAHFIDLLERLLKTGHVRNALNASANAAAIRPGSHCAHFDPVIAGARVAAEKLGKIVHAIHDYINIAVVIEVAKGAAAPGSGRVDAWATFGGDVFEAAVVQVTIQKLLLRISSLGA